MSSDPVFRVEPFAKFTEVVRVACNGDIRWEAPRQVKYLQSYLKKHPETPATTIVVESSYVDRHYLEEFTAYYASSLRPPSAHTTRLHIFSADISLSELDELIEKAASGSNLEVVEQDLSRKYLGFTIIRPIPSAPVGRTLLTPYPEDDSRQYQPVVRGCCAHLLGLELKFDALPFEQQDQGVGACASVALWASMAKIARSVGMRAPTPFAVTSAATKNSLTDRVVPASSGLDIGQFANAIRELGFAPYTVKVNDNPETFLWTLKVYLRSGIPAVLILRDGNDVHAVAVAGHREHASELTRIGADSRILKYGSLKRVYVHDDRIGPYVKMVLEPDPEMADAPTDNDTPTDADVETKSWRLVRLRRVVVDDETDAILTPNSQINFAVYPLYPKLRLSASDLAQIAVSLAPLIRGLLGAAHADGLSTEAHFIQNGAYLRDLFSLGADAPRIAALAKNVRMSRYVAVIRWFLHGAMVADVVCDTTDILRDATPYASVLAVFFVDARQVGPARELASGLIAETAFF